jgi:hypothetical protein
MQWYELDLELDPGVLESKPARLAAVLVVPHAGETSSTFANGSRCMAPCGGSPAMLSLAACAYL